MLQESENRNKGLEGKVGATWEVAYMFSLVHHYSVACCMSEERNKGRGRIVSGLWPICSRSQTAYLLDR